MRWQRLFADLEAQLDGELTEALDAELADRVRGELAKTTLEDRVRGSVGRQVVLDIAGLGPLVGVLRSVGSGWLIVDEPSGCAAIVFFSALRGARDLSVAVRGRGNDGAVGRQIGIGHVLRVVARDRTPTVVLLVDGGRTAGTIDRVGADYFDLVEHPFDEVRRPRAAAISRTIAFSATAALRPTY